MFEFLRNHLPFGRSTDDVKVPESMWERVEAGLPFLDFLEAAERARLRELARAFLAEKQFHGAHELVLTDEMMLAIGLQACLPILHRGLASYAGWVGVIVYPGDFIIPRKQMDEDGVVHEFDDTVLGEAWDQGPVVISWNEGAPLPEGANVVIHEFAHKLDMANGEADGFPPLPTGMSVKEWARVFTASYEHFCDLVDADEPTPLDPYAAEHPAEFFAVASEAFFEAPLALAHAYPGVYEQLRQFYRTDPAKGERRCLAEPGSPHGVEAERPFPDGRNP